MPHPVRLIGAACTRGERIARRYAGGDARREFAAGAVLCAALVGGTYAVARWTLRIAGRIDTRFALALEIALAWTTLAARDLLCESAQVAAALEGADLPLARARLARIVGRDTLALDASEVARATIETLAESACDGIVAPLVALALGGVPLALAFKAASTLDSMIGHSEPPYTFLGRASARVDDVACWIPARVTALAICTFAGLTGGNSATAFQTWRTDGARHRSPNAGHPEAAIAGALQVRLGGTNRYGGVAYAAPLLGVRFASPTCRSIETAMRLIAVVSLASAVAAIAVTEGARHAR